MEAAGLKPLELGLDLGGGYSSAAIRQALRDKKLAVLYVIDRVEVGGEQYVLVVHVAGAADPSAKAYLVCKGHIIRGRAGWLPFAFVRMLTLPRVAWDQKVSPMGETELSKLFVRFRPVVLDRSTGQALQASQ
jgi:hypothetical protein